MSLEYSYVLPPTGQADNHIVREMFDDIKEYINDSTNFDFATKELDNLGTTAINTSLISDTDNTDDLGSSTKGWKDLYLAGDLKVGTNIVLSPNADGSVNKPLQPSFLVTNSAGDANVTGDGTNYTIVWGNEIYDQGGDFSSNTFTAPVTGKYLLEVSFLISGIPANATTSVGAMIISNRSFQFNFYGDSDNAAYGNILYFQGTVIVDMDANDTAAMSVTVNGSTKTVDLFASAVYNHFSGSLIN